MTVGGGALYRQWSAPLRSQHLLATRPLPLAEPVECEADDDSRPAVSHDVRHRAADQAGGVLRPAVLRGVRPPLRGVSAAARPGAGLLQRAPRPVGGLPVRGRQGVPAQPRADGQRAGQRHGRHPRLLRRRATSSRRTSRTTPCCATWCARRSPRGRSWPWRTTSASSPATCWPSCASRVAATSPRTSRCRWCSACRCG